MPARIPKYPQVSHCLDINKRDVPYIGQRWGGSSNGEQTVLHIITGWCNLDGFEHSRAVTKCNRLIEHIESWPMPPRNHDDPLHVFRSQVVDRSAPFKLCKRCGGLLEFARVQKADYAFLQQLAIARENKALRDALERQSELEDMKYQFRKWRNDMLRNPYHSTSDGAYQHLESNYQTAGFCNIPGTDYRVEIHIERKPKDA